MNTTYPHVNIPILAYYDAMECMEETANEPEATLAMREAFDGWQRAKAQNYGNNRTMQVSCTLPAWRHILREMIYRWEINGGNGNPFGIEREELPLYREERQAAKVAVDRIRKLLGES